MRKKPRQTFTMDDNDRAAMEVIRKLLGDSACNLPPPPPPPLPPPPPPVPAVPEAVTLPQTFTTVPALYGGGHGNWMNAGYTPVSQLQAPLMNFFNISQSAQMDTQAGLISQGQYYNVPVNQFSHNTVPNLLLVGILNGQVMHWFRPAAPQVHAVSKSNAKRKHQEQQDANQLHAKKPLNYCMRGPHDKHDQQQPGKGERRNPSVKTPNLPLSPVEAPGRPELTVATACHTHSYFDDISLSEFSIKAPGLPESTAEAPSLPEHTAVAGILPHWSPSCDNFQYNFDQLWSVFETEMAAVTPDSPDWPAPPTLPAAPADNELPCAYESAASSVAPPPPPPAMPVSHDVPIDYHLRCAELLSLLDWKSE